MELIEICGLTENRGKMGEKVIKEADKLSEFCESLKKENRKIVLMTGCFDLVHGGHLDGLCDASEYGSLIVGINSDKFVKKLKGDERPIREENDRAYLMAGFSRVEAVTIFDDDCELMKSVRPDFYIASITSHEKVWEIPEQMELLRAMGTKILVFGPEKKDSTTGIIKRVLDSVGSVIERIKD